MKKCRKDYGKGEYMLHKKNLMMHFGCLGMILAEYLLIRYVLIDLHGMYQWPVVLLGFGMIVLAISFFKQDKVLPLMASGSYLVSFIVGVILQTDGMDSGGERTNTLWIIWTVAMITLVVVGFYVERYIKAARSHSS